MNVIEGDFKPRAPADTAPLLRELADAVDRGEILNLTWAFIRNGEFEVGTIASPANGVVLAALIQSRAINRMFQGGQP